MMSVLEFIGHALIRRVSMPVVIRQNPPSVLKFLRRLDRMRVVVTKNPLPVGIMERERVADAVRDLRGRLDPPCLDLDPIPVALINDLLCRSSRVPIPGSLRIF